jgi:endonuclease/exonuclease/phosphatase family metal-dependent hydrolase
VIPHNEAVIVAGDFNDWSGRTGLRFEMQSGMREAFRQSLGEHAKTFPSNRPFLGLDRIYYRGVDLIKCNCLSGHPWQKMSDHLPLYAEFSL